MRDGLELFYVKKQTYEICLAAVKQNGLAWAFIRNKEYKVDLYEEAIKSNARTIELVIEKSPTINLFSVIRNCWSLQYIEDQTLWMCLIAVKQHGETLEFVKDQTEEICLEAVKENGLALRFVKEQTPEICRTALRQNPKSIEFVKNFDYTPYTKDYELD
jgi:hypothetical protein